MSRTTNWRALCAQADPDFERDARRVPEYEFTGSDRSNDKTHEDGKRVFRGDYQNRGPYADDPVPDGSLLWNGLPISWDDVLTWDD